MVRVAVVRPDPPDVTSTSHDVSHRCRGFFGLVTGGAVVTDDRDSVGCHIRCCWIHRMVGVMRMLEIDAIGSGIFVLARIDASYERVGFNNDADSIGGVGCPL